MPKPIRYRDLKQGQSYGSLHCSECSQHPE